VDRRQDKARHDADADEGGAEHEDGRDQEAFGDPVSPIRIVIPEQPVRYRRVDENGGESHKNTEFYRILGKKVPHRALRDCGTTCGGEVCS
jgi:hypothetical protein